MAKMNHRIWSAEILIFYAFLLVFSMLSKEAFAGLGSPEISIGIQSGNFAQGNGNNKLGGLEPHLKWSSSGTIGEVDIEGGLDVIVTDFDSLPPCKVWSKVKKAIYGANVLTRAQVDVHNPSIIDVDVRCDYKPSSTTIQMEGVATRSYETKTGKKPATTGPKTNKVFLSKVKVIQTINDLVGTGGDLLIIPTFDLKSCKNYITLNYGKGCNDIQLDATSRNYQKITMTSRINSKHTISPSITNRGDFSLSYGRKIDNTDGELTTTYTPKKSINLKWEDGLWEANINAPIKDKYYPTNLKEGLKVSIKRTVDVM